MFDKQPLVDLIRAKALKFGDFTLASGKKASFYLDTKQVTLDAAGARLIGEGILDLLAPQHAQGRGWHVDRADPITASIITVAGIRGVPLLGFMVAQRGERARYEPALSRGPSRPGDDVIVEDVVTTGGSAMLAIDRAIEFGIAHQAHDSNRRPAGRGDARRSPSVIGGWTHLLTIRDFGIEPHRSQNLRSSARRPISSSDGSHGNQSASRIEASLRW